MKRALSAIGTLVAVAIIPGAVVVVGLIAAYRYIFVREDKVTDETLRRIRAAEEQDLRSREMDDARVIPRRTVLDGPPPTSALTKPWSGN